MKPYFPVFLIDVDCVLVEPHGYRRAIQATLAYYTQQMGLGDLYPGEAAINHFESINMTSEWDFIPIILASIFDGLVRENPGLEIPDQVEAACVAVKAWGAKPPHFDLRRVTKILGAHYSPGTTYSDLALALSQPGSPDVLFPNLVGHPLLENILANTRTLEGGAPATRIFQHYTLGAEGYEMFYGQPRLFEGEAFLETYDRPLLKAETREMLLNAWHAGKIGIAVFTVRPSSPKWDGCTRGLDFSPEAEVALKINGLSDVPLIGSGQMGWLASQLGCGVNDLTKPNPAQAVAAITAAVTRQEKTALLAAGGLTQRGDHQAYAEFAPLSIHIFEDSGGNIRSVRQAAEILAAAGVTNRLCAWGIAENPDKRQALENAGARLMTDINEAVSQALVNEEIM